MLVDIQFAGRSGEFRLRQDVTRVVSWRTLTRRHASANHLPTKRYFSCGLTLAVSRTLAS
ncbi:hypothetical protein HSB1_00970 [Halogranum salarium B-1]|uniref:Uncharacterized protein n=1 Tax=Halogranum salarium B-1 TaxID=1210908 RepID=J3JHK3_9EURY|nr:hypothetical protein HSB1_00970 [Halogranum salarium B-1]